MIFASRRETPVREPAVFKSLFVAAVATVAAVCLLVLPSVAAAAPPIVPVEQSPAEVRAYWTPDRIEEAVGNGAPVEDVGPLEVLRAPISRLGIAHAVDAYRYRKAIRNIKRKEFKARKVSNPKSGALKAHGLVVFKIGSKNYGCSGTVVQAPSRSLVWTAAHCMSDATRSSNKYANNWAFVPAYKNGNMPYGVWPAVGLGAHQGWFKSKGNFGRRGSQFDFGVALLAPQSGQRIQDVVGARRIRFNGKRRQKFKIYGYPASSTIAKFDGEMPFFCKSKWLQNAPGGFNPKQIEVPCELTTGASGGGWVGKQGRIYAVSSYEVYTWPPVIGGAYLGPQARKFYNRVADIEP